MTKYNFLYDNSMPANAGPDNPPFWPQTLDFALPWDCQNDKCPKGTHAGIWEIPLNQYFGYFIPEIGAYKRGGMIRAVMAENETEASLVDLMRRNFNRGYQSNRAPFLLTLAADVLFSLDDMAAVRAVRTFLEELMTKPDVYVVTNKQLLDWMRQPVPLTSINSFPPLQCNPANIRTPPPCVSGNKCIYKTPDLSSKEHVFRTCAGCPKQYPWLNNPEGM